MSVVLKTKKSEKTTYDTESDDNESIYDSDDTSSRTSEIRHDDHEEYEEERTTNETGLHFNYTLTAEDFALVLNALPMCRSSDNKDAITALRRQMLQEAAKYPDIFDFAKSSSRKSRSPAEQKAQPDTTKQRKKESPSEAGLGKQNKKPIRHTKGPKKVKSSRERERRHVD